MSHSVTVSVPHVSVRSEPRELSDLRQASHPEFGDGVDLAQHVERAFGRLGYRQLDNELLDQLCTRPDRMPSHAPLGAAMHTLRDLQSVRGSTREHGTDTYSRYKQLYEPLDVLWRSMPLKYRGERVLGWNAWIRVECFHEIMALCKGIERPRILEVGCGFGGNMIMLQHLMPNAEIWGLEYTHARMASSIVNLMSTPMKANLFLADATALAVDDDSYDVVFSFHVLEQLGQDGAAAALKNMARVARVGVVSDEPGLATASSLESWRLKTLGYCRDLPAVARELAGVTIERFEESECRNWPNTSHTLVLRTS